jgi:hypothetical protein
MYISNPVSDHRGFARSPAGSGARPTHHGLGELHGTHHASKSFPEPNNCWSPGATGKPDWSKTILTVEAALEVPATCTGSIIARTTLRDVVPGGASWWADSIRFGVSDGTDSGGLEKATRVSESDGKTPGIVEFVKMIPWDGKSCTARNDLFVYVKFPSGGKVFTFMEIGFYPRVESDKGLLVDKSLPPAIRLNPCNNLAPIRSRYVPGKESQQYWKLPQSARQQVNNDTDRVFREETGVVRKLDWNKPKDRPLLRHWLRIRDSVMGEKEGQRGQGLQGQEPMPYGSFAGTLGTNSHPAEIQKLLDEVRKRPQDYKALLLTIIFDPFPGYSSRLALSDVLNRMNLYTADAAAVLLSRPRLRQIVRALEPIRAELQKRDAHFQQLIDAELKLRYEMMETARGIRPQKRLEPFLVKALSISSPLADLAFYWLGLDFAKKMFPAKLTQRIMRSAVSVGHLTYLGQFLRRFAEVMQRKSPVF